MKIYKLLIAVIIAFNLVSCKGSSSTEDIKAKKPEPTFDFTPNKKSNFPEPIGIVNDYGNIFTKSQNDELTNMLYIYDKETTRQIVVVTIDSIKPYSDIHKFATDLGQKWGVGTFEKNNGLTIVVSKPLKKIAIATGTGTERILTDQICKDVIETTIIPELKNEKYYEGIKKGVIELIRKWQ